jgi:selenocysteine lyase/cysteine desulfurase
MSTATLDVEAVRARYSALQRPLAFFDGPGGTQCPDEVIDAISAYLRESNANIGAPSRPLGARTSSSGSRTSGPPRSSGARRRRSPSDRA